MSRNVILIAVIVVIAGYFYMNSQDKDSIVENLKSGSQQTDTGLEQQIPDTADKELIENLVNEGIISRIDQNGDSPEVYVTAKYYRIPEIDKKAIMEVLMKSFNASNPDVSTFTVYDEKSGDEVATYGPDGYKEM